MVVATWNLNSIGARKERFFPWLHRRQPDVVCLQELKCEEARFPFAEVEAAGYHAAVYGQRTYNGVAILSKTPLTDIERGFNDGVEDPAARFIRARVDGVTVCSAYIPNGQEVGSPKYAYKLQWLERLYAYLKKNATPKSPWILAGDFNVAPEDRDVHNPDLWRGKILFSDPERSALAHVSSFGLGDTFRKHHPEGGRYTWWDYRQLAFPKDLGLRIDFILATGPMLERCGSSEIERDERKGSKPSDHVPVLATFH